MTRVRDDVAAMLRDGATHAEIIRQLHVSTWTIICTRRALNIPVPPDRIKRSRAELAALDGHAVAMLRAGATGAEVRQTLRLSPNRITDLRKKHKIPVPRHDRQKNQRLTIDEAFTLYALPTTDGGHLLWTGPHSGRGLDLTASGRKYNARSIAFEKHHGRAPEGRIRRTRDCDQPDCIAGAHLTDHRIRQAHQHADQLFNQIFRNTP